MIPFPKRDCAIAAQERSRVTLTATAVTGQITPIKTILAGKTTAKAVSRTLAARKLRLTRRTAEQMGSETVLYPSKG
jgi:hypothetical protein